MQSLKTQLKSLFCIFQYLYHKVRDALGEGEGVKWKEIYILAL